MKKLGRMMLTLSFAAIMMLVTACGSGGGGGDGAAKPEEGNAGEQASSGSKKLKVGYYVNATLGDKSFFDSVKRGLDEAEKVLDIETKTIEGGTNQADWAAGVESMIAGKEYDVVLVGTSQMTEIIADLADRYPDQKFIFFDDKVPDKPNVYSMTYSQSEGSFLAGAFAALVTTSTELEGANPEKLIGFVGGMDIPIINDFKGGYEQGAKYVDPEIKIVSSYINDFADAPKAKELALAQYAQKVDITYQVAAAAGLGVLEAGKEQAKYTIGVDSNQNGLHPGSVLTSMMKNLDKTTLRALMMFKDGHLPFGSVEVLGAKDDGVGLARDELYDKHVPQAIREKMAEIESKLASGDIKVESIMK